MFFAPSFILDGFSAGKFQPHSHELVDRLPPLRKLVVSQQLTVVSRDPIYLPLLRAHRAVK